MHDRSRRGAGALEWWYRPIVVADSWLAMGYLAVGALWAVAMFVVVIAMFMITFALTFVVVGILLIVPTFALLDAMCGVERRHGSCGGHADRPTRAAIDRCRPLVVPVDHVDAHRPGAVATSRVRVCVPRCCTAAVHDRLGAVDRAARAVLRNTFDLTSVDLLGVVAGLALAGAAPRITTAVAGLNRSFVAWFLGPDPTTELQGHVDTLADQRGQILEAVGAERRRIERNLHDGVQQQLVALGIDIARAQSRLDDDPAAARQLLDEALVKVRGAVGELRVIDAGSTQRSSTTVDSTRRSRRSSGPHRSRSVSTSTSMPTSPTMSRPRPTT